MIRADIAELEQLTDLLVRIASDADDVLSRLRQISSEMHEDIELAAYPQSLFALEAVSGAVDALNRGNDTMQSLKNVMLPAADAYRENEQRNIDALSRMTVRMDTVGTGYQAAIVSNGCAHVEHCSGAAAQEKVQQLVADSVEQMQVTNIAAVTRTVREEYRIAEIKELADEG